MNLGQLRFVAAAASELSFSRAAERCNVTQPTLSNGIALLEEELGGRIFVRTTRKVEVSPFGAQVLPLIEAVLRAQSELEAGVRAFHHPERPRVRIGLSPLADVRLIAQVLEPYEAAQVGVETFFKECFVDDLDDRLRTAQIDVAVRPRLPRRLGARAIARVPIYEEDLLYVPRHGADIAPGDGGPVRLRDVSRETFVLCASGCGLAATTRALFGGAKLALKEYGGQALSFQVMQEWADLGIGATILPRSKLLPAFRDRAHPLLLAAGRPARVVFEAAWSTGRALPAHVRALHRHFESRVPKLVAGAVDPSGRGVGAALRSRRGRVAPPHTRIA